MALLLLISSSVLLTSLTPLNPLVFKPSSVSVPVLSKTRKLTLPPTLIFEGDMQNIFYLLSRFPANIIPTVMAAGRAGGTVIVNTSSILKTISVVLIPIYIFLGTDIIIPMIAKINKTNINFIESE